MKKSFMTRALATGLSLAMACSLSVADVSTAAAASLTKVTTKTITEGKSTKVALTTAAAKKYKIKSYKLTATAKQFLKAEIGTAKKAVTITAKKNAVTNAGATQKNLKITLNLVGKKDASVKKTAKVNVVVKAKPVEKLTMTAEATGIKTITVSFNKAIADASKVKATVKKGTAARDCKATVDGSKITLTMDAKLTKGDYTVSVEGVADEVMTASLTVANDETLTSFEIADYIVAKSLNETTTGAIKFAALNQYGEKMTANAPTVSCSFGKATVDKAATATSEGEIKVEDINPVLAIVGNKGTVVLVGDMGVTATKEISYNSFAKAVSAEIVGTYHTNSATLKGITEGNKLAEYELLLTLKDQYGYEMGADQADGITVTITGGLTNINVSATSFTTRTLNGKDYVAVKLAPAGSNTTALAGDATMTIVNKYHGMLANDKISVAKSVVIKNMTITADNGVYAGQENEMGYEFIDADGKAVTNYATLKNCINLTGASGFRFEQKSDGTAKLIFDTRGVVTVPAQVGTDKASCPHTATVTANTQVGGDYLVKTFTFTVYEARFAKGVTGIATDATTSISKDSTGNITIGSDKLVLADQYSNKVTSAEGIFNKAIFLNTVPAASTGTAVYIATNGAVNADVVDNNKIVATPAAVGTATVYLKYKHNTGSTVTATASNYDAKFAITVYDTKGVDVSTLEIDSVNSGFAMTTEAAASLSASQITVKALVGGVKTVIPTSQYVIVKNENKDFSAEDITKGVWSKTAKVTVQVTTWDSANTPIDTQISKEYTVSREGRKLFKVTGTASVANYTVSSGAVSKVDASVMVGNFKFRDQFGSAEALGNTMAADKTCVAYKIEMLESTDQFGYTIVNNNQNSAQITFSTEGTYKYKVTATTPDGSSKSYTVTATVDD